ncbi:helix-turn-helix domain-containing protein [Arcobacter defluvii]|uniref:Transcriptional regulator, XRE family n=1 Tax=Arcobacter defluvii TaxID=873191 RepID=A0AAE7E6D8_9BACT|nr:helix-turn-helix transcriptional regulator [Arcobacter defluvii]QKF77795.1 transcriptional regulator, XRE family [Arcobacter defluvii]RXI34236.1 transcriptional regulator [Arcobacter defluvii]
MLHLRLKEAREKAGLTLEELAKKINISKRTLQNYESNKNEPTVSIVNKIAEFCYEDEIYLLTGNSEIKINYEKEILKMLNNSTKEEKEYIYHLIKVEYIKNKIS